MIINQTIIISYLDSISLIALAAFLPAPIALIAFDSPTGATSPPAYTQGIFVSLVSESTVI